MDIVEIFVRVLYACVICIAGMTFFISVGAHIFHSRRCRTAKGIVLDEHAHYRQKSLRWALLSLPILLVVIATVPLALDWLAGR